MATTPEQPSALNPLWKLWVVAGGAAIIAAAWLFGCKDPALAAQFPTLVGGVLALAGMFVTGQVANNWVVGKNVVAMAQFKDENGDGIPDEEQVQIPNEEYLNPPAHPVE